ncbi:Vomeronasal type-2 receptor 26 [Cricetulus griseus]|uniref:Vomeronasal type-2 receptor 26 n=1 Tax=Cricetulus griseus TaxID=10029 RepID=G3HQU4_CRIGR|nr:Vomeronasal type-2 receptor 26 [Cricetulus griseus]
MGINIPNYTCRRENKAVALLTGVSWATSARIGRLLNLYKYPQLSFGPFDSFLSDRSQFSSLYQTAPRDTSLFFGIVSLMIHFSWSWVGLILIDNHKGIQILSDFREEFQRNKICVAFIKMMSENMIYSDYVDEATLRLILMSSANVVIFYDDTESAHGILLHPMYLLKTWKVWVMNSQMDIGSIVDPFVFDSFHGTIYFVHHHDEISDFRKFMQTYTPSKYPEDHYLARFWNLYFNCSFSLPDCKISDNCLPNASLELLPSNMWNMDMTEEAYNMYNSVYAVAHSLHEMTLKQIQIKTHGNGVGNPNPLELPSSVCSESCVPGFRKSTQEGQAMCCYDCIPCPLNEISNKTDMDNCVKCPESHYANAQQTHCFEKAVTFLSYEDPLGMALSCMSLGCSVLTLGVFSVFVKHHHTPIVKANNQALTYILLMTLTFCFLCPLLFIGHPNTVTCILQQSTFAVLFMVALSTVLAKTLTVVLAFKSTVTGRMVSWIMKSRAPNYIIPICSLILLVLCGIWLSTSPPFTDSDAYTEHGHIIIICNKGSTIAFHSVLGYLCSMALGNYILAYLSRNLPDTFNEAKLMTFSMLVFFSVWVTFLPVYHSTKGKVMLAMEVFAILASSAGLLGFIFAPKCYILLLRPERNSLHFMKSKTHSIRKF